MKPELKLINTNLRRYTFESPKIKKWVEDNCSGLCLNLFAGKTKLNINEVRNDLDMTMEADYHLDVIDFVKMWKKQNAEKFETVILDPPYSFRKAIEKYNGNYNSKFKMLADLLPDILNSSGRVISFGYHSTFMGKKRGFTLEKMAIFAHGGAQHCTIGIVEARDANTRS